MVAGQQVEPEGDQSRVEHHAEEPHTVERRPSRWRQGRAAHDQVIERRVVGELGCARNRCASMTDLAGDRWARVGARTGRRVQGEAFRGSATSVTHAGTRTVPIFPKESGP